jgi:hypothetical protein
MVPDWRAFPRGRGHCGDRRARPEAGAASGRARTAGHGEIRGIVGADRHDRCSKGGERGRELLRGRHRHHQHVPAGRWDGDRSRRPPDGVVLRFPDAPREGERSPPAPRRRSLVGGEASPGDASGPLAEAHVEGRSERIRAPLVSSHERDARAQTTALVEHHDVGSQGVGSAPELRPVRDDGHAHPGAVSPHDDAGARPRAHVGDRRVAAVHVDLVAGGVAHVALVGERDPRVSCPLHQGSSEHGIPRRRADGDPLGRGPGDRDGPERCDEDVGGEHDVNGCGASGGRDERPQLGCRGSRLERREAELHPLRRQPGRTCDGRRQQRPVRVDGDRCVEQPTDVPDALSNRPHA